jgi:hypothetical protein
VSDRQKFVQKIKSNIFSVILLSIVIRYVILLILFKKNRSYIYYFDIVQYFGEFPEFYYLCAMFVSTLSFIIFYIFNHSNINDYEWLQIIKVLNGSQSLDSLKIYNKNEIQEFIQKIKSFKFFVYISAYSINIFDLLTALAVSYLFFNTSDLIRFGIFSAFIFFITGYCMSIVIIFCFLYYFIICFYCKTMFKSFNYSVRKYFDGKAFLKYKTIDKLIKDHNSICLDIKLYNKFWQKYYFSLTYTLIPINLLMLQLILFEEQILPLLFALISFLLGTIGSHFIINLMSASINSEASKLFEALLQMYRKTNSLLNTNRKIKVN